MKNSTFLFALAISATLMITTSGCKHSGVGHDTIYGTTRIPSTPPADTSADKNGGLTQIKPNDNVPPVVSGNNVATTEVAPKPPSAEDMAFSTNGIWGKAWDSNPTPDPAFFAKDTVYFELDSSVIRSSEQSKLEDIATYFKTDTNNVLMIEGHCDERGTEQYNLALGDRRALAVREYLANLGVEPARIRTVSYGESRPVDPGHNEAAWSKNRRGVSVLMRVTK